MNAQRTMKRLGPATIGRDASQWLFYNGQGDYNVITMDEQTARLYAAQYHAVIVDEPTPTEIADALREVSHEISAINRAAGETRFNPAATGALRSILDRLDGKPAGSARDASLAWAKGARA